MRTLQVAAILFVSGCWFPFAEDSDTKTPTNEAYNVASGLHGQGIVGGWRYIYQDGCVLAFAFNADQTWLYERICPIANRVNHHAVQVGLGVYVYDSGELELFTTESTCRGSAPYEKMEASVVGRGTQLGLILKGAWLIFERIDIDALAADAMPKTPSATAILGCFENNGWFQPGPLTRI